MENSFDKKLIVSIINEIDGIKQYFAKLNLVKESLDELLEEPLSNYAQDASTKVLKILDSVIQDKSRIQLIKGFLAEELKKPLREYLKKDNPSVREVFNYVLRDKLNLELTEDIEINTFDEEDISPNFDNVNTLKELSTYIAEYKALHFNNILWLAFQDKDHYELGSSKFYNELPLGIAQQFIYKFQELIPKTNAMAYEVVPYDLNDELAVYFETEDEAKDFANTIAPSTVFFICGNTAKEIACY